jgi:hypothetical protein
MLLFAQPKLLLNSWKSKKVAAVLAKQSLSTVHAPLVHLKWYSGNS